MADKKGKGKANPHEGIWQRVLRTANDKQHETIDEKQTVLVFGNEGVGKSSLVSRLLGDDISDVKPGLTMSYSYIGVQDDFGDLAARLNIWEIPHEEDILPFSKFALNHENAQHSVAIVCFDLTTPPSAIESITKWTTFLENFVQKNVVSKNRSSKKELVARVKDLWVQGAKGKEAEEEEVKKEEVKKEGGEEEEGEGEGDEESKGADANDLGEDVLANNFGLPVVFVGCKSDVLEEARGRRNEDFEHDAHLLHYRLRRLALKYGAPLLYTSSLKEINTDLLLGVLSNVLLGFPVKSEADVLDHIYIPPGWDSIEKIKSDVSEVEDQDEFIGQVKKDAVASFLKREQRVVVAESDEEFLQRHYAHIQSKKDGKAPDEKPSDGSYTAAGGMLPRASSSTTVHQRADAPSRRPQSRTSASSVGSVATMIEAESALSPLRTATPERAASPNPSSSSSVDAAKRDELRSFFDNLIAKSDTKGDS